VHDAINYAFGTGRGGLPGNDDSGALSSWYVWASLGLFPVAGQNLFLLHPPSFVSASIRMSRGTLAISTDGFMEPTPGGPTQYVQSATFNGVPVESWVDGSRIHAGGELHLVLGPKPSAWGTSVRPPSHPYSPAPIHP
jgi:putative alpha-1,2-mannosidase